MKNLREINEPSFILKSGKQYNLLMQESGFGLLDFIAEEHYRFNIQGFDAINVLVSHFEKEKSNSDFLRHMDDFSIFSDGYVPPETILLDYDVICLNLADGSDIITKDVEHIDGYLAFQMTDIKSMYYVQEKEIGWFAELEEYEDDFDEIVEEFHFKDAILFYGTDSALEEILDYLKSAVEKLNEYYRVTDRQEVVWGGIGG